MPMMVLKGSRSVYDYGMAFLQETEQERALRRIISCTHTLYSVSDELEDPEEIDDRADLLIAVENLIDVALHVTDSVRRIAWQDSNENEETESDYD
jgi:hypothetical protein